MRTRWLLSSFALAAVLSAGCVDVSVTRVGDRFPPNAKDCQLEFQYGGLQKAMQMSQSGYVQVGTITVVKGGDSLTDEMKKRVRPHACEMGGQFVMLGDSSPGSFTTNFSYASFMVLRKKD
jgi:hypothetical protein